MPKLQRIKRSNGSLVFSINIPLEIIEELCWEKGNELNLEVKRYKESSIIMVFKKEDLEREEKNDSPI